MRMTGNYWRRLQKPISSSCIFTLRTRSETWIDTPLFLHRLTPPSAHHQRLEGSAQPRRHLLQACLVALWDVHSLQLLVLLVSGPCVDLTGAVCQHWLRYVTSPPTGPMMGGFWQSDGDFTGPVRMIVCQNTFYVQGSFPICWTSVLRSSTAEK